MSSPPLHTPPPLHYPASQRRVGRWLRPSVVAAIIGAVILVAATVTAAVVLSGPARLPTLPLSLRGSQAARATPAESGMSRPPSPAEGPARASTRVGGWAVMLTSAGPIDIGQGVSITPAPGWKLSDKRANSVALQNADASARMYVTVKPSDETDAVAVLQADINQSIKEWNGVTGVLLGKPATKTLQSNIFQQAAAIDYIAGLSTQEGSVALVGTFSELLNTSNRVSVFIDYRHSGQAPDQAVVDGKNMLGSML
ncbi:hypothetical protein [Mycobacterium simiae]|uniref:hypothetical protein n=1 Tax=Mycobacterium simiae TaxID=1784 RepID=UPI0021CDBFB5|nr:hypothetical protein [Mycobacterium simiae]